MQELWKLFWIFFKMGACCFGGGYALLPIIQRDIVEKYGYATSEEIADFCSEQLGLIHLCLSRALGTCLFHGGMKC